MDKNKNSVFFAPGKPDHFVIGVDDDYIVSPASAEGNPLFEGLEAITTEEQARAFALRLVEAGKVEFKADIEARDEEGNTLWVKTVWEKEEP